MVKPLIYKFVRVFINKLLLRGYGVKQYRWKGERNFIFYGNRRGCTYKKIIRI